jgi:hypothetical protein
MIQDRSQLAHRGGDATGADETQHLASALGWITHVIRKARGRAARRRARWAR